LDVAGADGDVVLAAGLSGENIGPGAYWSPVRGWIARGEGAAIFDGTVRLTHGFLLDGVVTARDVDVPAFARTFDLPHADLLRSGRGSADLGVELEPGATDAAPFDLSGKVRLENVALVAPE